MSVSAEAIRANRLSLAKLLERFVDARLSLVEATIEETGFTFQDSFDLSEACRSVIEWFLKAPIESPSQLQPISLSKDRFIELTTRPVGGVAVVLPHNASVYLGLLAGLSAMTAGNRVWLKFPGSCGKSADIVRGLLANLFGARVEVVSTPGKQFMEWALSDPNVNMVHFIGGSEVAVQYLSSAFEAGKQFLIDGNGNGLAYVSHLSDPEMASVALAKASTRFNGQTCTSTNGAIVHPLHFGAVCQRVKEVLSEMSYGDPFNPTVEIGELFSSQAVSEALTRVEQSQGTVVKGGVGNGNCMMPTLIVEPTVDSDLVREGVFAPVLWLKSGTLDDFERVWSLNRYPLCAGVFTDDTEEQRRMSDLPNLSRLTVNGDTSFEDPLEPWGACPPSGNGRVEPWINRYTRTIQLDSPREKIGQVPGKLAYVSE